MRFSYPNIRFDLKVLQQFDKIFNSGWVANSGYVRELEKHFIDRFDVKHAIATCNATQGLVIAVAAAGWGGKRVALPVFTWPSTLYALAMNGCEPVLTDIDKYTWAIDSDLIDESCCDAVMGVDTFGAETHVHTKLPLIMDAAHGYGLPSLGKRALVEVVSLSHTKIVTGGEGGIILTNDDVIAEYAEELRRLSARMPEVSASIALNSIENYDIFSEQRKRVVNYYIKNIGVPFHIQVARSGHNNSVTGFVFHNTEIRDKIVTALNRINIEVKIYYKPLKSGFKNADDLYSKIICLPTHKNIEPYLDKIIKAINNADSIEPIKNERIY